MSRNQRGESANPRAPVNKTLEALLSPVNSFQIIRRANQSRPKLDDSGRYMALRLSLRYGPMRFPCANEYDEGKEY